MTEAERNERTAAMRGLLQWSEDDYDSDQKLRRTQPPLVKAPMRDASRRVKLPVDFDSLDCSRGVVDMFLERKSHRVYTDGPLSLLTFSFLIWAQQGVRGIRGKQYATLRTVPSGGARHPFELYAVVRHVEGLVPGIYHYLPMEHALELLRELGEADTGLLSDSLDGQKWAAKANAVFYYSIVPYRGEWRYAFCAHRVMLIDAGHVMENLYLALSAVGLGGCAIGAVDSAVADEMLELDGKEEFTLCAMPIGTVSDDDSAKEQGFYSFLKTEEQYYHQENNKPN